MSVIFGNNLEVLPTLDDESVQLVYLDPPFFTNKTHSLVTRDNSAEYSFSDNWESREDYLNFIRQVLVECRKKLKPDGSIFLHCDKSASHYLRILLDEVFGENNFQSEIIWAYKRWSNAKKGLLNSHQNIYFYSKSENFKFNFIYTDYSPTTNIDQILQARERNGNGKSAYQRDENGKIVLANEKKGVPLSDVWNIPFLNPKAKERVGYPTQKPILLLERIIEIATNENDVVLDAFCGSGTSLVAAKLLNREFIGIDISAEATELTNQRLANPIKSGSNLLEKGEESYLEKSDYERSILKILDALPVERNSGIDGFLREYVEGKPVSVRVQKNYEDLETAKQKLIEASLSKDCSYMILVRTNSIENSLFQTNDERLLVIDSLDFNLKIIYQRKRCKQQKYESSKTNEQF
jgi:site-specific DNA-methyltransferase (adenine-specific)